MRPLRRFLVPILWLTLAVALSGCLDAKQLSAMEAQEATDPLAHEADPGSRLVFAAGLEGRAGSPALREMLRGSFQELGFGLEEDDAGVSFWDRLEEDGTLGDGRSELWVLVYSVPGSDRETVYLVGRGMEILHDETRPVTGEHRNEHMAVDGYEVDSSRAMQIARQESKELEGLLGAKNLILGSGLVHDPAHGAAVWTVSAIGGDLQGVGGAVVQVDAQTGELLHSEGRSIR